MYHQTLGIVGAGQLGQMLALSAIPLGIRCRFLTDQQPEACVGLGQHYPLKDYQAWLTGLDRITFETENVDLSLFTDFADAAPIFPQQRSLSIGQHRDLEKNLFRSLDIPTTDAVFFETLEALNAVADSVKFPSIMKTVRMGYDGRGQTVVHQSVDLLKAWQKLDKQPCIIESKLSFQRELSVILVRSEVGEIRYYAVVDNQHVDGILRKSRAPALDLNLKDQSVLYDYSARIAEALNHVGVLTVEFFETGEGLIANEIAPRVHNSGHWTSDAAYVSQFENHIRAIFGWPLGSTEASVEHCMILNVIGQDVSKESLLDIPSVYYHDYAKKTQLGRKLGHITVVASTTDALMNSVSEVNRLL